MEGYVSLASFQKTRDIFAAKFPNAGITAYKIWFYNGQDVIFRAKKKCIAAQNSHFQVPTSFVRTH